GQRLSAAVSEAGARLSDAASAAGERVKSVAEGKGLNSAGVKETARDVVGAFAQSLAGDHQEDERAQSKQHTASTGVGGSTGAMRNEDAALKSDAAIPFSATAMRSGTSGGSTQSTSKSAAQPGQGP